MVPQLGLSITRGSGVDRPLGHQVIRKLREGLEACKKQGIFRELKAVDASEKV